MRLKDQVWRIAFITLLIGSALVASSFAQPRFFDTAEAKSDQVRLTIFYPTLSSINDLIALRNNGLIQIENLVVIGVFHAKERTNYQASIEWAEQNQIQWLKFHRLAGELNKDVLFQTNALTDEFKTIFEKSDGIIFFGGADIPPYIYRKQTSLFTEIETPYRSFLETSFIFHLLGGHQNRNFIPLLESDPSFPILGICLGCQSLNVGTGGTLVQDIWSEIYGKGTVEEVLRLGRDRWHTNPYRRLFPEQNLIGYNMHPIKLHREGKLVTALGFQASDQPMVISSHHQMAGRLGKGMKVIATSLDGRVIESLEHQKYPNVLGVQFHPEFSILYDRSRAYRFRPEEVNKVSLLEILEGNPPSLEFHQKLWHWFSEKLKAHHNKKVATDHLHP
ncbi:MAG: gamma-glutamyl-gamma-aminobutyrate hydrolase family protein [candidate division KSB1 bacterium]|nr:gamma-glutamyl-gamma-aminobutyrate hydrolase family protein [candidate division KSB1 bacterium]